MTDSICVICQDDPSASQTTTLTCGHCFHVDCIVSWFRMGNDTCPMCRDNVVNVRPRSTHHRYTLLRRLSRRRDAPEVLRRRVERLRSLEADQRTRRRALREFRRECAPILKELEKLQRSVWTTRNRIFSARRSIGQFVHPKIRVPLVESRSRSTEMFDSYESDDSSDM